MLKLLQSDSARPPVAVVGAGISGLVAAHSLHACGLKVKVFDKGRASGGRASTRRYGETAGPSGQGPDVCFDHGAQYFTARDPCFRRYVGSWLADGIAARWEGRIAVVKDGRAELKPGGPERFVGIPGMSAVARQLATDLDVTHRTRVAAIERRAGGWRLADDDGTPLGDFGAVVVSTPPAQAVPLLAGAPELAARAAAVGMRPCWAVMAVFDRRLELPFDGAFVEASALSWIARNGSKPGRARAECWVLHGSPEWSARHLEADHEDVCDRLLQAFFDAVGHEPRAPRFTRAHRWRYSIAEHPLDAGCLWDAGLQIGACGDWCSGSRIEGAFLSGKAIAGRVLGLAPQEDQPDEKAAPSDGAAWHLSRESRQRRAG